jgi:hypothetical protein
MRRYLYSLLARYLSLYVRPEDRAVDLDSLTSDLQQSLPGCATARLDASAVGTGAPLDADYVILNGTLHYERDIQTYLNALRARVPEHSRLLVVYYSALWRPLIQLATRLGWREKGPEANWLSPGDVANLLALADFEPLRRDARILMPINVPLVSAFVNRYLTPLPGFRLLAMVNLLVARPTPRLDAWRPSVSVVIPARNEAGNIEQAVMRLPKMGPDDEVIFVEGGSRDDTWQRIQDVVTRYGSDHRIVAARQDGRGKGDAVRKGFALANNEILMILDADLTVPPEDLPKFYDAIVRGKGEFINGSRLVYPMEGGAMRFLNLLANKFFAVAFSFVLGQRFKDTLCGTKVMTRRNYERIAAHRHYFGEFDPFGDFDLIFGAARLGLRIVEVPVRYRERTYGATNISRWRHGAVLLGMLGFAASRLRFI